MTWNTDDIDFDNEGRLVIKNEDLIRKIEKALKKKGEIVMKTPPSKAIHGGDKPVTDVSQGRIEARIVSEGEQHRESIPLNTNCDCVPPPPLTDCHEDPLQICGCVPPVETVGPCGEWDLMRIWVLRDLVKDLKIEGGLSLQLKDFIKEELRGMLDQEFQK